MAIFEGTKQEFHHFIGPRIRNAINNFTRNYRQNLNGICEMCGQQNELQSAHVHGRGRRTLIEEVINQYSQNGIIRCNIEEAENKILNAHLPIETSFKFLCHSCHVAYDSNNRITIIASKGNITPNLLNKEKEEIKKVQRKIPRWFKNPNQINSRILASYLILRALKDDVSPEELRDKCSGINDFDGNYNQMKSFGVKNHAKVFDENNNTINLWKPVEEFILENYEKYKNA